MKDESGWSARLGKNFHAGVFLDTSNVIKIKLCMLGHAVPSQLSLSEILLIFHGINLRWALAFMLVSGLFFVAVLWGWGEAIQASISDSGALLPYHSSQHSYVQTHPRSSLLHGLAARGPLEQWKRLQIIDHWSFIYPKETLCCCIVTSVIFSDDCSNPFICKAAPAIPPRDDSAS